MARILLPVACCAMLIWGCRDASQRLQGGTQGTIWLGAVPVADLQVNVFNGASPPRRVAYGVSNLDGDFSLITDDGQQAMSLPAGQYRITVESVAADPIPIPMEYRHVERTPLVKQWDPSDGELVIEVN